jgi:hypothetical protein
MNPLRLPFRRLRINSFRGFSASYNYPPQHPPTLFDLILKSDWAAASRQLAINPQEARYKHPRGYTMLHCAVESGAPLEFIQAMVNAYPEGVNLKDWKGRSVEEACLFPETKDWLRRFCNQSASSKSDATITTLDILHQLEKISSDVSSLERSCRNLQINVDALIAKLKGG